MRTVSLLGLLLSITACTTTNITTLSERPPLSDDCKVTLYSSREQAEKAGGIKEEVCLATTYSPKVDGAIEGGKREICQCGVNKAFIRSTSDNNPLMNPHVIIVGFE